MPNTTTTTGARREFNATRFTNLTQDQIMQKAKEFNDTRVLRAATSISEYRMIGSEGQILNLATGVSYEAEDVRRWDALPGTVVFLGCSCEDEQLRLAPMRAAMQAKGCGVRLECKHTHLRNLFSGAQLRTSTGLRIKIKPNLFGKSDR